MVSINKNRVIVRVCINNDEVNKVDVVDVANLRYIEISF